MDRQQFRKTLAFGIFLLFPIIMNYFSPIVPILGSFDGIITGSIVIFCLMFVSSIFLGRFWCGWLCPAGSLQETCFAFNNNQATGGKWNLSKWIIWIPWLSIIAILLLSASAIEFNFFYKTVNIISVDEPVKYIAYYIVIGLFFGLSLLFGKRAGCHYICWMAPFMVIGTRIRNIFKWPALHLEADSEKCNNCNKCTKHCTMSLNVNQMVEMGLMQNAECTLCGTCIDICPENAIKYSFKKKK